NAGDQAHFRCLSRGSRCGRLSCKPDDLALRRRVTVAPTTEQARAYGQAVGARLKSFVAQDERLSTNVPDAPPPSGAFTLSDDEFVTGTPKDVAQEIIEQCRAVGAGHFLAYLIGARPSKRLRRRTNFLVARQFLCCERRRARSRAHLHRTEVTYAVISFAKSMR